MSVEKKNTGQVVQLWLTNVLLAFLVVIALNAVVWQVRVSLVLNQNSNLQNQINRVADVVFKMHPPAAAPAATPQRTPPQ